MPQTLIPGLRGRVDSREGPSPAWSLVLPRFQRPRLELYDHFIKWDNSDPQTTLAQNPVFMLPFLITLNMLMGYVFIASEI